MSTRVARDLAERAQVGDGGVDRAGLDVGDHRGRAPAQQRADEAAADAAGPPVTTGDGSLQPSGGASSGPATQPFHSMP
jgi:hypothetical protein